MVDSDGIVTVTKLFTFNAIPILKDPYKGIIPSFSDLLDRKIKNLLQI